MPPVSLLLCLSGNVRGAGVARSHTGASVWSLWSRPGHPTAPPRLLFLRSHLVKGGRVNGLLTRAPSDRRGRRGLHCHWLTAGESAMRIGGCRETGMKICVRRRWCWWRSCASTPREATARVSGVRSSATWWEDATDSWTQVRCAGHLDFLLDCHWWKITLNSKILCVLRICNYQT